MMLDTIEASVRTLGAVAALGTLSYAVVAMLRAVRAPADVEEPGAKRALRPTVLIAETAAFAGVGVLLWRPIPMPLGDASRVIMLIAGSTLLFGGLGLYLAGMRELGAAFAPSSGFGVRLQRSHGLVTDGVFRWLRHPMYAGVICASCGVLLIYRTWSGLALAVTMLGLVIRARREERVLARRYGVEWDSYTGRTPAWFPGPRRRGSA